jgi:hypothetical protein
METGREGVKRPPHPSGGAYPPAPDGTRPLPRPAQDEGENPILLPLRNEGMPCRLGEHVKILP